MRKKLEGWEACRNVRRQVDVIRRTDGKEYLTGSKGADAVQIPTHELFHCGQHFLEHNAQEAYGMGYLQVFTPEDYGGDTSHVFFLFVETGLNSCVVGGRCGVYRNTRYCILILTPVTM